MAESNRSGLTGSALIVALLAALGIGPSLVGERSATQAAKAPTETQAAAAKSHNATDVPEHSAAELLETFLGTNLPQIHGDKPWSKKDEPAADRDGWRESDIRKDYEIRFLIATLPQPDNPSLSARFDSNLDAISLALVRAGYQLAAFDLPWLDEATKESYELGGYDPDEDEGPSDSQLQIRRHRHRRPIPIGREGEKKKTKPWATIEPQKDGKRAEHDPGVMLFHREEAASEAPGLIVLFVVGESPTRGGQPDRVARCARSDRMAVALEDRRAPSTNGSV